MISAEQYAVYRNVINRVLNDEEQLPSLPSLTLKIRQMLSNPNTTVDQLSEQLSKDPALSALLLKTASSPIYRTVQTPNNLRDVISLLGMKTVESLVMLHSVRSLVVLRTPQLKKLFGYTWKRLSVKAGFASFLASKLDYEPTEEVIITALLTEVGSLSILSALQEFDDLPDDETYFSLCRSYSKSLSAILLSKWNVDAAIIKAVKQAGQWQDREGVSMTLSDITNLALYNTVLHSPKGKTLPEISQLAAYQKLPPHLNQQSKPNQLLIVAENFSEIKKRINSYR